MADTPDITQLLNAAAADDDNKSAQERLFVAVYDQLHRIATAKMLDESNTHTLQPTALINEAYPRLIGATDIQWKNRSHFLGAAAEAIRRILIDHARKKKRQKRGGDAQRLSLTDISETVKPDSDELLALNDALLEFEKMDSLRTNVVKLKFFCGLSNAEIADALNLSLRTVERHWTFSKAWLLRRITKLPNHG